MKNIVKTIILTLIVSYWPISLWAISTHENNGERNYFQFAIPDYHTTRQSGQTIHIYVKYAYEKNLPENKYTDYRKMRTRVLKYMEPSDELPTNVYWEIIATRIGRDLMQSFPIEGVSVQLYVLDNQNPSSYEPGDHGPTFTMGNITPLDVHPQPLISK